MICDSVRQLVRGEYGGVTSHKVIIIIIIIIIIMSFINM